MARPYSLRRRLLLWLLVPLLLIGAVALLDTWREAVATSNAVSDRVLAGSALAIAERVVVNENGTLEVDVPYVALEMLTSAAQDRVFYRVDGPPGTFITGYQTLPVQRGDGSELSFSDASFRGEPIRLAVLQRAASSGVSAIPFVVTVAETTLARTRLAQSLLFRSALRLGLLILAAAIIVWVAVSASLSPLYRLRDAIGRRNPEDLHPIDEPAPREVQSLVDTVNSFMKRLGTSLEALRNFTGNAGHQLRTPLAIARTQLELARRAGSPEALRQALDTADNGIVHGERVIAQLLLLSRIDTAHSHPAAHQPVDLTALAKGVATDNVLRAHAVGIDLGFEGGDEVLIRAEPVLVAELVHNLIDNAVRHAGEGARATVRVTSANGAALLEIEDDGRGMSPEHLTPARRRFRPGAASGGAGLGLGIVAEIADLFGGRLHLAPGSGGKGLRASVSFPPLPDDGSGEGSHSGISPER